MNAILRERYEAPVLTNEAIEVHLAYLRTAIDALTRRFDEKIGNVETKIDKVDARIDKVDARLDKLDAKIDKVDAKVDKANELRAAGDATLSIKMDKLTEKVLAIEGHHKTVLWLIGLGTLIASLGSIARTLDWI